VKLHVSAMRFLRPFSLPPGLFAALLAAILAGSVACAAGGAAVTEEQTADSATDEASVDPGEEPAFPVPEDDEYFHGEIPKGVAFMVLITQERYMLRQVRYRERIRRESDPAGDADQLQFFQKEADRIDFKDWTLTGTIDLRLSPISGQIEHIQYVPAQTPRTWQAAKFFQDDVSRLRFTFPDGVISPRDFMVQYEWRIEREPGLSDEEARARAMEYLKSQVR